MSLEIDLNRYNTDNLSHLTKEVGTLSYYL